MKETIFSFLILAIVYVQEEIHTERVNDKFTGLFSSRKISAGETSN